MTQVLFADVDELLLLRVAPAGTSFVVSTRSEERHIFPLDVGPHTAEWSSGLYGVLSTNCSSLHFAVLVASDSKPPSVLRVQVLFSFLSNFTGSPLSTAWCASKAFVANKQAAEECAATYCILPFRSKCLQDQTRAKGAFWHTSK